MTTQIFQTGSAPCPFKHGERIDSRILLVFNRLVLSFPSLQSVSSRGCRLVDPQNPTKDIFRWQQEHPDSVGTKAQSGREHGHCSIKPVVVRRCHDNGQHEQRVADTRDQKEHLSVIRFARLPTIRASENARVVQKRRSNTEGVCEVQTRHGSQLVDIVASNPDGFGVLLSDSVVETEFFRQQTRRHAGEEREDEKGCEITQSHGSADDGKGRMVRSGIIVP